MDLKIENFDINDGIIYIAGAVQGASFRFSMHEDGNKALMTFPGGTPADIGVVTNLSRFFAKNVGELKAMHGLKKMASSMAGKDCTSCPAKSICPKYKEEADASDEEALDGTVSVEREVLSKLLGAAEALNFALMTLATTASDRPTRDLTHSALNANATVREVLSRLSAGQPVH